MAIVNKNPEYFLTIAQEKSITKAADILYVSQSYLSQHISKLENSFDVQLFSRSKIPIELTEAGKIYFQYLQASNKLYSKLINDFDSLKKTKSDVLNIGVTPWYAATLLPDILTIFMTYNTDAKIYIHEYPTKQLLEMLEKDQCDIAIMNILPEEFANINIEYIQDEKLMLMMSIKNIWAEKFTNMQEQGVEINLNLLEDEVFIMLNDNLLCAQVVSRYFDNIGFNPSKKTITSSKNSIYNLVSRNLGVSLITPPCNNHFINESVKFFDLQSPLLNIPLVISYKKNSYLSNWAANFISVARTYNANR